MENHVSEVVEEKVKKVEVNIFGFLKWLTVAGIVGGTVGLISTGFYYAMVYASAFRENHSYIMLGLPLAGILIVWMYHISHRDRDQGTNMIISSIRSGEEIPVTVAPLIMISTVLTHLFGGSAGREGAALQLGGSIANWLGKKLHMSRKEVNVIIMCGMSAAFSALFGTPMAAAFFPMEVVSVGIMYYAALVPCVFASLIAYYIAHYFGVQGEAFTLLQIPEMSFLTGGKVILLAVLCAGVSVLFCIAMHTAANQGKKRMPNPYLRAAAAGIVLIVLTALFQTTDYLGAGMNIIERSIEGEVRPEAFLLKIIFTAITLGAGYKGGEIVPSFFVGATFGCLFGQILGISPSLCAGVGMIAVFCGVTNSPVTSMLIALELFGMEATIYFLIAVSISYMLSGYYGLYHSQKIMYSKFKAEYLDRITH